VQNRCSPTELIPRTTPLTKELNKSPKMVGLSGLEPLTPALSAQCSNHLSYRPESHSKLSSNERFAYP
jgi:hypothetical protein